MLANLALIIRSTNLEATHVNEIERQLATSQMIQTLKYERRVQFPTKDR